MRLTTVASSTVRPLASLVSRCTRAALPLLVASALAACDRTPPRSDAPASSSTTSSATASATDPVTGTVRASGSSALQPLVNAAKEKFEQKNKGVSVDVSAGGSKKGISDVAAGAVQIGNSDVYAPDDLKSQLVDHKVAVVGFAAMANKGAYNEKVAAITMDQLAKVFTGEIKNWKDLGGQPQPIVLINRAAGSGTRAVFANLVLGSDRFVESQTEDNSGALVAKLKQTKGAISYLALSFVDPELVTLALKGDAGIIEPTAENIQGGAYPIWSYEHMYTKGEPTGAAKTFLDYVLSSEFQTQVLPGVKGFLSVNAMKVSRDKD